MVQPEWTLDIVLPLGATITDLVNAVRGNRTAGPTNTSTQTTALIANHVDQTLEARGGNSVQIGTRVNATTQVRRNISPTSQLHLSYSISLMPHSPAAQVLTHGARRPSRRRRRSCKGGSAICS